MIYISLYDYIIKLLYVLVVLSVFSHCLIQASLFADVKKKSLVLGFYVFSWGIFSLPVLVCGS